MNRVVITGMGIYSTIGKNIEEVNKSLYVGASGVGFEQLRKDLGFRSGLTGIIERPDLKGKLKRRQRIGLAEEGEYAYIATLEALNQAKIDDDFLDNNDVGILYGNDSSAKSIVNSYDLLKEKKDTALLGSGAIFQSMNSTITMNLSTIFKLRGINLTVSAACASGSHALGIGYNFIKSGLQDIIICGGGQEINHHSMGSFDGLSAFSIKENEPQKASRPFDRDRDGLV
nr:beta-ketoacyl synthase N-terminal-like domain-containing protein [Bacteroidales bacterium]